MDTHIDIVRNFMNALEINEFEQASNYLAEHFIFSGWVPNSLNKQAFITCIEELKEGIPGLIFNLHNVQELDNRITGTMQVTGYQTDSFTLTSLNLPSIPQMARSISLPTEDVTYLLHNDQIEAVQVQRVMGGGIKGLLQQLGINIQSLP